MRVTGRISAGDLRERITLQTRTAGQDALGAALNTWADAFTVWAKADPLGSSESFAAGQMQAQATVKFTIRHRADVVKTQRVVWRGVPYEIMGPPINVDGARDVLELMCTHGLRDGR